MENHRNVGLELLALLEQHSSEHAERFRALYTSRMGNASPLPSESSQIASLNTFWRVQLGLLDTDTVSARCGLVDNIPADWWLSNFERYVLGTVLCHMLPSQRFTANASGSV